jgi:hypothetical protein
MASDYDPVVEDAQNTLADIQAELEQAQLEYKQAARYGDEAVKRDALRRMGNLNAEYTNAAQLANQYWRSQHPPAPPPETIEQKIAKPLDRMGWGDVYEMCKRGSKYGVSDADFQAGMAEIQRNPSRNRGG